jgi:hypothetical protein
VGKGVIGSPYTFTALFTDGTGTPVAVTTPTIEVFYYDATGVRIDLVAAGTVLPDSIPAETGRYAYLLDPIPDTLDAATQLYGILRGDFGGSTLIVEREVDLFAEVVAESGLRTSFTKAGDC